MLAAKESTLRTALTRLMIRRKVSKTADLIPVELRGNLGKVNPRYVRVNIIKTTVDDVVARLHSDGFKSVEQDPG